jgi:hypothetical protein
MNVVFFHWISGFLPIGITRVSDTQLIFINNCNSIFQYLWKTGVPFLLDFFKLSFRWPVYLISIFNVSWKAIKVPWIIRVVSLRSSPKMQDITASVGYERSQNSVIKSWDVKDTFSGRLERLRHLLPLVLRVSSIGVTSFRSCSNSLWLNLMRFVNKKRLQVSVCEFFPRFIFWLFLKNLKLTFICCKQVRVLVFSKVDKLRVASVSRSQNCNSLISSCFDMINSCMQKSCSWRVRICCFFHRYLSRANEASLILKEKFSLSFLVDSSFFNLLSFCREHVEFIFEKKQNLCRHDVATWFCWIHERKLLKNSFNSRTIGLNSV